MPKRLLDDWLTSHLQYTEHSESPTSYLIWSGISCIAAALQRRVYMNWETKIFPNQYVILIGPSGRSRKGFPLDLARSYLEDINVNLMAENPTPEAFIRDMHLAETSYQEGADWIWQSPVTCVVEELAVLLGQNNVAFLSYLTNWYDSRYKWVRRTKHQGTDTVLGVCLNILGSSAPEWLPGILSKEAIGGGFTSRCMFVVEERKRQTILDPSAHRPDRALYDSIVHDLETMLLLTGEYRFEDAAKQQYMEWYGREEDRMQEEENIFGDPALNGYAARRSTHLRKLAMAFAASGHTDLIIREQDLGRAILLLEETERRLPSVFAGIGRSKYAAETELVLSYIKSRGSVRRSQILAALYRDLDEAAFESVMAILVGMKKVTVRILSEEDDRLYQYNP